MDQPENQGNAKTITPNGLITAFLFVCERILREDDFVLSAIRIVDLFKVPFAAEVPPREGQIIIQVLATGKYLVDEDSVHAAQIRLIRPSGETNDVGEPTEIEFKAKEGPLDHPSAFNLAVTMGLTPKEMGTHYCCLLLDGQELARTPITLIKTTAEPIQ